MNRPCIAGCVTERVHRALLSCSLLWHNWSTEKAWCGHSHHAPYCPFGGAAHANAIGSASLVFGVFISRLYLCIQDRIDFTLLHFFFLYAACLNIFSWSISCLRSDWVKKKKQSTSLLSLPNIKHVGSKVSQSVPEDLKEIAAPFPVPWSKKENAQG